MSTMTSRERVETALGHREPDRVPIDLGSTTVSGMHASAVYRLRQALALDPPGTPVKVIEPIQMLGETDDRLLDSLGVDTQRTLPFATPREVEREVAERLGIFGRGGGFVFGAIHNVRPRVPVENIRAMFASARGAAAGSAPRSCREAGSTLEPWGSTPEKPSVRRARWGCS